MKFEFVGSQETEAEIEECDEIQFNLNAGPKRAEKQKEMENASASRRSEKLKQINHEMKQCITELHKLMQEGGLAESAEMLKKLPGVEIEKQYGSTSKSTRSVAMDTDFIVNSNMNANITNNALMTSEMNVMIATGVIKLLHTQNQWKQFMNLQCLKETVRLQMRISYRKMCKNW